MWAITHLLTGMAIGAVVPGGIWVGVAAALLGHLAFDMVPHWDYTGTPGRLVWGSIDVLAAAVVAFLGYRFLGLSVKVLVCGIVSAAPDLDVLNALLPYKQRTRWFPSHWTGFPHGKARPLPGIAVQVLLAAVSIALVLRFG
jgi:hypothetical protein